MTLVHPLPLPVAEAVDLPAAHRGDDETIVDARRELGDEQIAEQFPLGTGDDRDETGLEQPLERLGHVGGERRFGHGEGVVEVEEHELDAHRGSGSGCEGPLRRPGAVR